MSNQGGVIRLVVTAGVLAAAALTGATAPKSGDHPVLIVGSTTSLADQALSIKVTGLRPGEQITIASTADDYQDTQWQGQGTFTANASGIVDPSTQAPENGTYKGVDPMGLFWSMIPSFGDPDSSFLYPKTFSLGIGLTVTADGRTLASTTLTRQWTGPGVTYRTLTLRHDKVYGKLFLPAPGTAPHPAVLIFGGSEGGEDQDMAAALLASHGYAAISLAYFDEPGLPTWLGNIPLEYFVTAAHILTATPGVDPAHILPIGYSRGSEAALLLAQNFPTLFHGAIVYSPSAQINGGIPETNPYAWTLAGAPITPGGLNPVNDISGPVLAIAGTDDNIWASPTSATLINEELTSANDPYPHQDLTYQGAGHLVGTFPYLPGGTQLPGAVDTGGTSQADNAARVQGWPKVLALLASLEH